MVKSGHNSGSNSDYQNQRKQAPLLLRRLYRLMARQLGMIERRHKLAKQEGADPMTSSDSEKEVRTLGSLTKQLEKMIELENDLQSGSDKGRGADEQCDTEQLRQNLTQRLANFGENASGKDDPTVS